MPPNSSNSQSVPTSLPTFIGAKNETFDQWPTKVPNNIPQPFMVAPHTHDGVDSTLINFSTAKTVYAGVINADGTAANLPAGWTSSHPATGAYHIVHNLNAANVVQVQTPDISGSVVPSSTLFNSFDIGAYTSGSGADHQFTFILVLM